MQNNKTKINTINTIKVNKINCIKIILIIYNQNNITIKFNKN